MSISNRTEAASFKCIVGRAPVNMCRLILLLTIAYIQVKASSESPPRVASCRIIYKSKEDDIYTIPSAWGTCEKHISLHITDVKATNMTDTRNCENFYQCQGYSCLQCPCPTGQTFNPKTLFCDDSQAECACPHSDVIATTATPKYAVSSPTPTTASPDVAGSISETSIPPAVNDRLTTSAASKKNELSTEVIIIAAIVSATVIIIVAIAMAVVLWQKNRRRHSKHFGKSFPVSTHEYSPAGPPSEGHVYAEINEKMVSEIYWHHGNLHRASALPDHTPTSMKHSPCPVHSCCDSGVSSVGTNFTGGYPITYCNIHHGHGANSISPRYVKTNHISSRCCQDRKYPTTGTLPSESHYSTISQQI